MNIAKIFCQSLGVTSHAKTFPMVCHFRTNSSSKELVVFVLTAWAIRSKIRMSSVQMAWAIFSQKMSSVWTACAIRSNSLGYPFEKKLSSIRTAWAIHLKKIVLLLNGYGYPFENEIINHSSEWSLKFKDKF